MKLKILLVIIILATAAGTCLGDCTCKEPQKPELPSDRADGQEMQLAGKQVNEYSKNMRVYRDCVLSCLGKADNDLAGIVSGWNHAVDMYNKDKK